MGLKTLSFKALVSEQKLAISNHSDGVFEFLALPIELRYMIYKHMTIGTLFRLQQVSKVLRAEAKSLFWTRPDLWFKFRAGAALQQIPKLAQGFEPDKPSALPAVCLLATTQIQQLTTDALPNTKSFWSTLNRYFTSVRRIVYVGVLWPARIDETSWKILCDSAGPKDITVLCVSTLPNDNKYLLLDYHAKRVVHLHDGILGRERLCIDALTTIPYLTGPVAAFLAYAMIVRHSQRNISAPDAWAYRGTLHSYDARHFRLQWENNILKLDQKATKQYKKAFIDQLLEDTSFPLSLDPEQSPIYGQLLRAMSGITDDCFAVRGDTGLGSHLWRKSHPNCP